MNLHLRQARNTLFVCATLAAVLLSGCGGGGGNGGGGGGGGIQPPSAPTGLVATAGNAQVSLTWNASSGATGYNVKRGTATGGPYTQVANPAVTNFTDTSVTNGTAYYYVVVAYNSAGTSGNSAEATATPALPAPAVPTGLVATPGNNQVSLTWNASANAASYHVKRGAATGGPYTQIAAPTTTSYIDTSAVNGTPYYYVVTAVNATGESGNSSEVTATPVAPPAAPTNLKATAGNAQVSLTWTASAGATSYHVKRGTATGGPYTQVGAPTAASYTDTTVTNGTPYYYVVTALNAGVESGPSNEATATPSSATAINVNVDVLTNRHSISPYVYGGAFPKDAATITDSGLTVVRWGGNATSTYNWQLGTDNADNDWYFEDFNFGALNNAADSSSTQFITDVKTAGSNPLMTMVMMNWVAQSPETAGAPGNLHWSFSKSVDNANQCGFDQYNTDAGDGLASDCSTHLTATSAAINRTYFPLLDDHSQSCPVTTCVYRNDWAAAMATAFGSTSTCPIPYFTSLTSCHFYDMDNEIDIWGGTHFDIHPNPAGYNELRDVYLTEARALKTWDPAAVRLGPVSCCWWFYWNGANGSDKGAHAGIDFLPWWLNEVYWSDQIAGTRSLDMFDIHAYPDGPNMTGWTTAQKQAAAVSIYRDYWDPTLVSPSSTVDQTYTTNIQPNKTIAFRIPRMRAIVNSTYPGTPLAITEWSAEFVSAADFSTALGDADAYGILGRERVSLSTRWTAPDPANPNYQALKLYTKYDGTHGFNPISVSATHNADPNLFSVYAATNAVGTSTTVMVLNKDPNNSAQVSFNFNAFTPTSVTTYTLSQANPTTIVKATPSWSSTMSFPAYSATLLVIAGTTANPPTAEWDLNPDTTMVAASQQVTLKPRISSTTGSVTLQTAQFDSGGGTTSLDNPIVTTTANGQVTLTAGATPGFYHFTVTGKDSSGVTQTQGGWLVVGNPQATIAPTSLTFSGTHNTAIPISVTLTAGQSGGSNVGASILFSIDAGSFAGGAMKQVAVTDSTGTATVQLTLPNSVGATVHIAAEAPYGLGHDVITFTATAN